MFEDVLELIKDLVRYLIYWLSTAIYQLVIWLYDIFQRLCNSRILDAEILEIITERVGVVLGIVMLFMVVFSAIQMVLEPERLTDKEKGLGNIAKKILLVIVMLGTSRIIFSGLYGIQATIIKSNIITKFILPYNVDTDNFGGILTSHLFTAFYYYDVDVENDGLTSEEKNCKLDMELLKNEIIYQGDFSLGYKCLNTKGSTDKYIMQLNILLLPIIGVVAVYFIFSYCLSVGTRTIQLAFLEIISPMAIVSYLSPKKDTMFTKWWKLYFSTYIDVFLRIMIIELAVFLIGVIYDSELSIVFWNSVGGKQGADILIIVFIVMALLMFAKKAPDLLKDLFPSGASKLGLGITTPKKLFGSMAGDKVIKSIAGNTIGLLGKKTIAGVDAQLHGQNFKDGWKSQKGKFGTWIGKQREAYMPNYNEVYKNKIAGAKEVEEMNTNWNSGADIAEKLRDAGAGANWDKVFDGTTANIRYYRLAFKNEKFIQSKMQVDYNSSIEDDLRRLQQKVNLEGATSAFSSYGGSITIDGVTYDDTNVELLIKNLEKQQKKVEGLKKNHASISKQCQKDAKIEEQFKYIKNNDSNPTNPSQTKTSRGL